MAVILGQVTCVGGNMKSKKQHITRFAMGIIYMPIYTLIYIATMVLLLKTVTFINSEGFSFLKLIDSRFLDFSTILLASLVFCLLVFKRRFMVVEAIVVSVLFVLFQFFLANENTEFHPVIISAQLLTLPIMVYFMRHYDMKNRMNNSISD